MIAICQGTNTRYQARVRYARQRRYTLVGKPSKSRYAALRRLAEAFTIAGYKRGDVIVTADYYEPVPIYELVRR
jgi:hypothetical protein